MDGIHAARRNLLRHLGNTPGGRTGVAPGQLHDTVGSPGDAGRGVLPVPDAHRAVPGGLQSAGEAARGGPHVQQEGFS